MSTAETSTGVARGELGADLDNAQPADLDVTIVDRAHNGKDFECKVTSPHVEKLREPQPEPWVLPAEMAQIVNGYMTEFADPESDREARLLALVGAGSELWEMAPEAFKRAYEEVRASGRPIETIQVTSDDPYMPWEVVLPDDGDDRPLGVRHTIARWFAGKAPLRATGTPAGDARVAAPHHNPPPQALKSAQAEADLVRGELGGEQLTATNAKAIEKQLLAWTGTVLHFVCHGEGGPPQKLRLDGKEKLSHVQVRGMTGLPEAWRESAPIVFLNACKAGQPVPTLEGAGGLARSWTVAGAGAVIAPLWSVSDEIAHKVATRFYKRVVAEPATPYAEIVRDIRALAKTEKHDSYAAYSYFGSPRASAAGTAAPDVSEDR